MSTPQLTPWFPGSVKPARPGVYIRRMYFGRNILYSRWSKGYWHLASPTIEGADAMPNHSPYQSECEWCGLAQPSEGGTP